MPFFRQHTIQVVYRSEVVGVGRLDLLVENQVIVELKAVDELSSIHTAQVLSYLRATRFHDRPREHFFAGRDLVLLTTSAGRGPSS